MKIKTFNCKRLNDFRQFARKRRASSLASVVNKDVRHKVAEIVANHVKTLMWSGGKDISVQVSFKPKEQYKPLSRGQLDMVVLPLSYAGGQAFIT